MLLIECPWCGARDEVEFAYGGEAHIARPKDPDRLSDEDWADYVFMRKNTKGVFLERWMHRHGCRRWFNMARDTTSHKILAVYRMGENPPVVGRKKDGGRKKGGGGKKTAAKKTGAKKTKTRGAGR